MQLLQSPRVSLFVAAKRAGRFFETSQTTDTTLNEHINLEPLDIAIHLSGRDCNARELIWS